MIFINQKYFHYINITQSDVDECMQALNPCDKNARCQNVKGSYICECINGYAGNGYQCLNTSGKAIIFV